MVIVVVVVVFESRVLIVAPANISCLHFAYSTVPTTKYVFLRYFLSLPLSTTMRSPPQFTELFSATDSSTYI